MKAASRTAVLIVLSVSLSGCENKAKTAPPPEAQAPVLPPSKMVHLPTLPALPPPPLREVALETPPPENPEPVHPHKTTHRKPSPAKPATGYLSADCSCSVVSLRPATERNNRYRSRSRSRAVE